MGGKRRDFSGQFAMSEIDFWFSDPRITNSSATFRIFIHYAWMVAVKERRETLPTWWSPHAIGKASGLDPKSVRKLYPKAKELSLLGESPDGRVIVYGVRKKHPNLAWKDEPISTDMQLHNGAQTESESESEKETERERKMPRKKRAASQIESVFIKGFLERYGHQPTITKPQAIAIAQKVSQHGHDLVVAKIGWWWDSPAGDWVKGARTADAFIKCFDRIVDPAVEQRANETPTERARREYREAQLANRERANAN